MWTGRIVDHLLNCFKNTKEQSNPELFSAQLVQQQDNEQTDSNSVKRTPMVINALTTPPSADAC
ncbi:MAG: hypothetical protein CMN96_02450 [Synechococcus sp. MED850]|jgi:hypothetical protein|nr:hypothetical protein [Synechococcus sp. MED850]